MIAPKINPDINNIKYPVYVQPIYDLPLKTEMLGPYKLVYYKDFKKRVLDIVDDIIPFEERLKLLRVTLSELGNYKEYIDVETKLVDNPKELLNFYKRSLEESKKGIFIKFPKGVYTDEQLKDDNDVMYELKPRDLSE